MALETRPLPDPDLSLRDASDFIFGSSLCRKALLKPEPESLAVFLRDLIGIIYRLTVSCHLAEFTDHGLHHLCSLIYRLSKWTSPTKNGVPQPLVDSLDSSECAVLLLATLFHDIGMLSQRPEDLPLEQPDWDSKGIRDVPSWVRTTHIARMENLVRRLFLRVESKSVLDEPIVLRAFNVARAHGTWPWRWTTLVGKDGGLAAALAVSDLLDEDSNRCDSATLLQHRFGNHLNCAHWIRHGLTSGRVTVRDGVVTAKLCRPTATDGRLTTVYTALRNHYRLALLYIPQLASINASLLRADIDPREGCPTEEATGLGAWTNLPGFQSQAALKYHLLNSFMAEALLDERRIHQSDLPKLQSVGLEKVDLVDFHAIRGDLELHSYDEQAFNALLT